MTELSATPPRRGTRTFRAAWIVLASVAAAQAASTALSSKTAEHAAAMTAVASPPEAPPGVPDPFSSSWSPKEDPHPEMQQPAGDPPPDDPALALLPPVPAQAPVVTEEKRAAPLDVPITDEEVLGHLDESLTLRGKGDMQGSLTHLRAALVRFPNHPKLLYHTAQTLDTMGLPLKAAPLWKSLYQLGSGAGDFYVLAQRRMADGPQALNEPEEEKEGRFTVKDLQEKEVPDSSGGQRVSFTAIVKKNTAEEVDVRKDLLLAIHFFDTVNGRRVVRSQVQQPELSCITNRANQLLDWDGGTETFSFEYWQPDMTPEQLVKFGRCKYFGCTLEVFYKDQLQDSIATTPVLVKMARELPLPPPEPANSLIEPASSGPQPESSLFPPVLKP